MGVPKAVGGSGAEDDEYLYYPPDEPAGNLEYDVNNPAASAAYEYLPPGSDWLSQAYGGLWDGGY
jgi:hypothetical protein